VWEIFDVTVAISAAQDSVNAGSVLLRMNLNVLAGLRLHSRLPVASQAGFVLFRKLWVFLLLRICGRGENTQQKRASAISQSFCDWLKLQLDSHPQSQPI